MDGLGNMAHFSCQFLQWFLHSALKVTLTLLLYAYQRSTTLPYCESLCKPFVFPEIFSLNHPVSLCSLIHPKSIEISKDEPRSAKINKN